MRISFSKSGVTAGLLVLATLLSLFFLLSGDDEPNSQPVTGREARQLIAQAALHEVLPTLRQRLGAWGGREAVSVGAVTPDLPAMPIAAGNVPQGASLSAVQADAVTDLARRSDVAGAHKTGRQQLAQPLDSAASAQVAFKKASDKLLVFAETLVLRSKAVKSTVNQKTVLSSPEGLVFEESLAPSLADDTAHADFALAQSLRRLGLPDSGLIVDADKVRDEDGAYYHFKSIRIYAGDDVPLFISTLRDSLLAWADGALFVRSIPASKDGRTDTPEEGSSDPEGGVWRIFLQGVHTHTILIHGGQAPQEGGGDTAPQQGVSAPRLVIVLDDLGESKRQAKFLLNLSYPVTFAVWPRSTYAAEVAKMATDGGAELIIHQPMEPVGYPEVDPGRGAMLFRMSEQEVLAVLGENLRRVPQAQGLNNHMGSWLTQNGRLMAAVSRELARRDMFVLDSLTHARSQFARAALQEGATAYRRDVFLDVEPEKEAVLRQLAKAEQIARLKGQAIAIGHPLPGTLAALEEWQSMRDKGISIVRLRDLAPLSGSAPVSYQP